MSLSIEIRELPPQRLLVKKTTCKHQEIGSAFGIAIEAVGECFRKSGAQMKSMPVAVYLNWRQSDCDMAVGCKVAGDIELTGGCEWLDLPGGAHACAMHFGAYEMLHETHAAIRDWCASQELKISGPCWESYPIDPASEPDSLKWQTDVHYPVKAR